MERLDSPDNVGSSRFRAGDILDSAQSTGKFSYVARWSRTPARAPANPLTADEVKVRNSLVDWARYEFTH